MERSISEIDLHRPLYVMPHRYGEKYLRDRSAQTMVHDATLRYGEKYLRDRSAQTIVHDATLRYG